MPVNIKADQIVNSNLEAFSFFFTDLQEGQGLVFNVENNRWENAFVGSTPPSDELSSTSVINSLRFDGTSSYLSRTPTTVGNRQTWTWSGWVKFVRNGVKEDIFIAGSNTTGLQSSQVSTETTDKFSLYDTISGGSAAISSTSVGAYRDTSSWYHLVIETNTPSSYQKIWVNDVLDTTATAPPNHQTAVNNNVAHTIGRFSVVSANFFAGYMANIQFIDGQALDASYFGETSRGIWVPKEYDGTSPTGPTITDSDTHGTGTGIYGTNGFHLDFSPASIVYNGTTITQINDVSGNNNHWAAN
jgi:hypothetical protein